MTRIAVIAERNATWRSEILRNDHPVVELAAEETRLGIVIRAEKQARRSKSFATESQHRSDVPTQHFCCDPKQSIDDVLMRPGRRRRAGRGEIFLQFVAWGGALTQLHHVQLGDSLKAVRVMSKQLWVGQAGG